MATGATTVPTTMRGADVALLGLGGAVLAHAVRHAEDVAVRHTRGDVVRRLDVAMSRWRRRGANAASFLEIVVGGAIVIYVVARIARSVGPDEADEAGGAEDGTDSPPPDAIARSG